MTHCLVKHPSIGVALCLAVAAATAAAQTAKPAAPAASAKPASSTAPASSSDSPTPAGSSSSAPPAGSGSPPAAAPSSSSAPPAPAIAPLSSSLTGAAKAAYQQGKILYVDGDSAGALVKFKLAYAHSKDPRLLWNMAACEKNLRHYAKSQDLVEQYLRDGQAVMTAQDRQQAVRFLQAVRPYVSTLALDVSQAGAAVYVDGERVGTTPLTAPLRVDVGTRHIKIAKQGFQDFNKTLLIAGGTSAALQVELTQAVHQGRLRVISDVGAQIRIDGKLVGVGQWAGTLPSGMHVVSIAASGKQPYQGDVSIADGQVQTTDITLESSYRPSGVPTWLWIVGGVVVAGGLSAGGYFLLRPTQSTPPATAGTMDPGIVHISVFK